MIGLDPRTRDRLLAVALLLAVFMAGGLSALALQHTFRPDTLARPEFGRPPGGPGAGLLGGPGGPGRPGGLGLAPAVAERLGLRDEQRERIEEILEDRRERSDSLLQSLRPQLEAELAATRDDIRNVLDEDQRVLFDRYVARNQDRLFRRLPPGGQGGAGGRPPGAGFRPPPG